MSAKDLIFSSREFLRLIENQGLTGNWGWNFKDDSHVWSPGLYRLLGLELGQLQPGYQRFLDMVHPDDRAQVASVAKMLRGDVVSDQTLRIIRPHGEVRTVSSHVELYVRPDGRPSGACGSLLDITDKDRLLRAQRAEQNRRRALFDQFGAIYYSFDLSGDHDFPYEVFSVTGLPQDEVRDDVYVTVVSPEREHWREEAEAARVIGIPHMTQPIINKPDPERYNVISVPVRNETGAIVEWSAVAQPVRSPIHGTSRLLLRGLEQMVTGRHLRAARALLDWSMADLSRHSGLSVSSVRRLEEDREMITSRTRHRAIETLRAAGIVFWFVANDTIAVAKA